MHTQGIASTQDIRTHYFRHPTGFIDELPVAQFGLLIQQSYKQQSKKLRIECNNGKTSQPQCLVKKNPSMRVYHTIRVYALNQPSCSQNEDSQPFGDAASRLGGTIRGRTAQSSGCVQVAGQEVISRRWNQRASHETSILAPSWRQSRLVALYSSPGWSGSAY